MTKELSTTAQEINEAHRKVAGAYGDIVTYAIQAGERLLEVKQVLEHGEFGKWVGANCEFDIRSAQRYMEIAKNKDKYDTGSYLSLKQAIKLLSSGNGKEPHVSQNSGVSEWYTPPEYIAAARQVMGDIDLDPASCELANQIVKAKVFYSLEDDGLSHDWKGRVWMNPPYSNPPIGDFCEKFAVSHEMGDVTEGIVLVNNATETEWFERLVSVCWAIVFPRGRVKFLDRYGNPGAPLQGQAVLYAGQHVSEFIHSFSQFGWAVTNQL